jgi:hypothetical protein
VPALGHDPTAAQLPCCASRQHQGGKVPVVVLNACQSGAVGKELEASVATALLKAGCAAVVAMDSVSSLLPTTNDCRAAGQGN